MGLTKSKRVLSGFRFSFVLLSVCMIVVFIGCGVSEEATTDQQVQQEPAAVQPVPAVQQTAPQPAPVPQPVQQKEPAKEESQMDQVLSNFVSSDELKAAPAKQQTVAAPATSTQLDQYEKQIAELRTENTAVKQRNTKLEEDNRQLISRLNDTETKLAAEKADTSAKVVAAAPAVEEPAAPSSYDEALKAFQARKYDEALKGFQTVASSNDVSEDVIGNAKYWIGETHFAKKNYKAALADFQGVLKQKKSLKKGDAQFMIGQTYERLGSKAKAKAAYEKVVKEYPLNKNVKRAKQRWAKL